MIGTKNSEISYQLYAGAAGILLHINGKFTMRKMKPSFLCVNFPVSFSNFMCMSRCEANIAVSVEYLISFSMG